MKAAWALAAFVLSVASPAPCTAGPLKVDGYWQVEDVRAGMRGYGRTVMKGTHVETFEAEVLGVLKNTSPGRDMVLCRLSGLNLDKTGVIAGMSGSPVYIDGRLLGAVAYAWPFGNEPIAGVTPFTQMQGYVECARGLDLVRARPPVHHMSLDEPVRVGGQTIDTVAISADASAPESASAGLWMAPLRTPLAATGMTPHCLELLCGRCPDAGMVPMQGGAATARIASEERNAALEPGSPMAVALVRGDFDLSGIGTVTHIEGSRVYGWGHPFFGIGGCEFPLMSGYIHTIYPRQSVSFKMGSPLRQLGVVDADVSTCIAGWLGRQPDMLPVRMTVCREGAAPKSFKVEVVRQQSLIAPLVYTVLTNSVDMEGDLPEELTAQLCVRIDVDGHGPVVIKDTFSGSGVSGGRAPQALYNQVAAVVNLLAYNSYQPVRINRIDCETLIRPGRRTAEVEAVELDSESYAPGDTLKGTVFVRPYKGLRQRLPISLRVPSDLPEGSYTAVVCDELTSARSEIHDNPNLSTPQSLDQIFEALRLQTSARRTTLTLRVPVSAAGVALGGKTLPELPPSMVQILGNTRRTGAQPVGAALVARQGTSWVIQGSESVRFNVTKNKKTTATP